VRTSIIFILCLIFVLLASPVFAEFKIILKNGGEFIVDYYKELDGKIKFMKVGGEIEIDKANIEDIIETKVKTRSYTPDTEKQEEVITEKPITDEKEKISPAQREAAENRLKDIAKRKDELKAVAEKLNEEKKRIEDEFSKKGRVISIREERELKQRTSEIEEKINKFNEEINRLDLEQERLLKEVL